MLSYDLSPNTTYYYRVCAYISATNSGYSNEAWAITATTPPTAPTNLVAMAVSTTQINLLWEDKSHNEEGFKVERKIGASGTWTSIADVPFNTTTYSDTILSPNTT